MGSAAGGAGQLHDIAPRPTPTKLEYQLIAAPFEAPERGPKRREHTPLVSPDRFRVGDVFTIPLDDDRVGFGQIVGSFGEGHYYFAVFEGAYPRDELPAIEMALRHRIALFALSLDALLHHGHWRVVGWQGVNAGDLPWPAYKEAVSPGVFEAVDHANVRRRRVSDAEAAELPFRTVVAPIRLEKALRALHRLEPWTELYEELRPVPPARTAAALFEAE